MLGEHGDLCLVDFGLAKRIPAAERSRTFCGTPEYVAPEVAACLNYKGEGYGRSADWWALGVLLYEMLVGKTPFFSINPQATLRRIAQGEVKFPPKFPRDAAKLCAAFLTADADRRLGSGPTGPTDVEKHVFFAPLDFAGGVRRLSKTVYGSSDNAVFAGRVADHVQLKAPPAHEHVAITDQFDWLDQRSS